MLNHAEIQAIRAQFPVFRSQIHLCSCTKGALSDAVDASLQEYLRIWRDHGVPWEIWVAKYEELRGLFARFIGAKPEEVAIICSTSQGISSIASALKFDKRRKVVMGELEFPATGHIWLTQRLRGAEVTYLDAVNNRIPLDSYRNAIDASTLIVPLTHVAFSNGTHSDLEGVIRIAHERGAYVIIDGYQSCGTAPIDVHALDVDFYVSGTLKYLLGSPGVAFLYVKESLIKSLRPTVTGAFAQQTLFENTLKSFEPADTARRFEMGSPPMAAIYGSAPGIELLQNIGLENVAAQIASLRRATFDGLRDMRVKVKTPEDSAGPMVVVQCSNAAEAAALGAKLAAQQIIASPKYDGLRIAFHVYNTLDDVNLALAAIGENLGLVVGERESTPAMV